MTVSKYLCKGIQSRDERVMHVHKPNESSGWGSVDKNTCNVTMRT